MPAETERVQTGEENEIHRMLAELYAAGRVGSGGARVAIDFHPGQRQIRLRGPNEYDHIVLVPQDKFVEMVRRSSVPITKALVSTFLHVVYFDPRAHPWARLVRPGM